MAYFVVKRPGNVSLQTPENAVDVVAKPEPLEAQQE